jgi:transcription elongation factor GreA
MEGNIPLTQDTYNKLGAELDNLKKVERPMILEAIEEARAQGDLKENAEYHAAKEKQGELEERIRYLEDRIARAEIIEIDTANAPHVVFGATVTVKNMDTGKSQDYTLVSSDAVDILEGKISSSSPIGKSLIGSHRGDLVEVKTPRGIQKLQIIDYK